MLGAQPVVDALSPDFEVGENPVHPGTGFVGVGRGDDMGIVVDAGTTGMVGLSAGLGGGPRRYAGGEEGVQARRGVIGHSAQEDVAEPEILNLNSTGDQNLAMLAASARFGVVPRRSPR